MSVNIPMHYFFAHTHMNGLTHTH